MCHFTKSFWFFPKKKQDLCSLDTFPLNDQQRIVSIFLVPSNTHRLGYQATALELVGENDGSKTLSFWPGAGFQNPLPVPLKDKEKMGDWKKNWIWRRELLKKLASHQSHQTTIAHIPQCGPSWNCVQECYISDRTNYTQCRWQIASNYSLIAAFWIFTCIFMHFP